MKKIIFLLVFVSVLALRTQAQVTIGSGEPPHEKALLDIKENADGSSTKGMILPRVALASALDFFGSSTHEKGAIVYNTNTSAAGVAVENIVTPGFYYNTGSRWEKLQLGYNNWFYMPSIPLRTEYKAGESQIEVDLYNEYVKQFKGLTENPDQYFASPGAPSPVSSTIPAKEDFYYMITKYDNSVFDIVSLTADGKLTYKLKDTGTVSDTTIMNIVFRLK